MTSLKSNPKLKSGTKLTRDEQAELGRSPSDGILGKTINPKVTKLRQL